MESELKRIYYGDSVGALRGPQALYAEAKRQGVAGLTLQGVKRWLSSQPVYTLYRPARRKYPRRRVKSSFPGDVLQADIMDMQKFRTANDYLYVLLAYDTYTKYLLGYPMKNRKPPAVQEALEAIFAEAPFPVRQIYWDKEGSFLSRQIQGFLKRNGIINYTTTSVVKAPGVERVIRTIRMAVQRFFEANNTQKWTAFLPKFIANYNRRVHSVTKLKPLETAENPLLIPVQPKETAAEGKPHLPPIGSTVRLNRLRSTFDKEASGNYTEEIFRVRGHKRGRGIPQIYVSDLDGDEVRGALYPQEYQRVKWDGKKEVEAILRTRKRRGHPKEAFVKFRGWPPKFNDWIPA